MNLSEIRKSAFLARKSFESGSVDYSFLSKLYSKYNRVKNIGSFIEKSKNIFPHLNCGLTSVYLKSVFSGGKIINGKYKNHNHTFLLSGNKIIVDITADQYSGPKVYAGLLKKPWSL